MDKIKVTSVILVIFLAFAAADLPGDDFDIGLTYYLMGDLDASRPYFNRFFVNTNNQRVADAYVELFKDNNWDAAERFKRCLDMNHRSMIAIIGMSLSIRHLRNSTSLETLERALRLHPRSPAVHVAMGYEYFSRKDYPKAEEYFARALNYGKDDIYRIPLGYLFLETNELKEVLEMTEKYALADSRNFHFNFLAARAHYLMNDWQGAGPFIQNAIAAKPNHVAGRLLWAQFLSKQNRSAEARDVLKGMQFDSYNIEYEKTLAQVLFDLDDRLAYGKMLEVLVQAPWDKDINRIMGLYHLKEAKGANIQHWINRALISGNPEDEIKKLFPAKYTIKEPVALPFFDVKAMTWLDEQYLIIGGKRKSGDKDQVFVYDNRNGKIVSTGSVLGDILQIRTSGKNPDWAVINAVARENQGIYIYSLTRQGKGFATRPVPGGEYRMADFISAFSADGRNFYFVSANLKEALYQAPFTVYDSQFQRRPLFPNFPLSVYKLTQSSSNVAKIKGVSEITQLPIKELRDYYLLSRAYQQSDDVRNMITEGYAVDLAASRTVKAFCNGTGDGAIVYITDVDAKRGFDAVLYSSGSNGTVRLNESAFLGKNRYAEVEVVDFSPTRNDLIVRTLGERKEMIHFSIKGKLTRILGENLLDHLFLPYSKTLYFLVEKKQKLFEKETQLYQVVFDRYSKNRIKKREDIISIQKGPGRGSAEFITFNGEILTLDPEYIFHYQRPALNTLLHTYSPKGVRAAFIGNRVVIGI